MNTTRRQFLKAAVAVPIAIAAGVSVRTAHGTSAIPYDVPHLTALQREMIDFVTSDVRRVFVAGRQMGKSHMTREYIKWSKVNDPAKW